jgi:hypothetical protein
MRREVELLVTIVCAPACNNAAEPIAITPAAIHTFCIVFIAVSLCRNF